MRKTVLLLVLLSLIIYMNAQVGINTVSPLASLHVDAAKTDNTTPEGIIAPRLTRAQLIAKTNNSKYTLAHAATFVYVTALDGTPTPQTQNITTIGYYYFDGAIWKHFNDKLQNADNGLSVGSTANVQLGGDLTKNTSIDAKAYDITIAGTATTRIQPRTTIGSNIAPPTAAILNLQTQPDATGGGVNANGGFMLPRVVLTDNNSLKPFIASGGTIAEKNNHKGMQVYHIGGNGFDSGVYTWNGANWMRYIDVLPTNSSRIFWLTQNTIAGSADGTNFNNMTSMTFSEDKSTLIPSSIILPETGSYAFAVRIFQRYAPVGNPNNIVLNALPGTNAKNVIYVGLFVNNVCKDIQILFGHIANFVGQANADNASMLTAVLSLSGNANDVIDIRYGSYYYNSQYTVSGITYTPCALALPLSMLGQLGTDATNMVFWKL